MTVYKITGKREGQPRGIPKTVEFEVEAPGPTSALRRFQWHVEELYGKRAKKAFPTKNITIEG